MCILKVQVPGVSMHPHHIQMQMTCSAVVLLPTVGNLRERGEPDILTEIRHWDLLRLRRTGQSTRDLHFKQEFKLHGNGAGQESKPGPLAS